MQQPAVYSPQLRASSLLPRWLQRLQMLPQIYILEACMGFPRTSWEACGSSKHKQHVAVSCRLLSRKWVYPGRPRKPGKPRKPGTPRRRGKPREPGKPRKPGKPKQPGRLLQNPYEKLPYGGVSFVILHGIVWSFGRLA